MAPAEKTIPAYKTAINSVDSVVSAMDEHLRRIEDRLASMRAKRDELVAFGGSLKGVVSPMRQLPPELLGEIFAQTLPGPLQFPNFPECFLQNGPWQLGGICSAWREAALRTPYLWDHIAVRMDVITKRRSIKRWLPSLAEGTGRAGKLPLHISISYDSMFELSPHQVLSTLLNENHRIQTLQLQLTETEHDATTPYFQTPFPALQHLALDWDIYDGAVDLITRAPKLSSLQLTNFGDWDRRQWDVAGFRRLKSVKLEWNLLTVADQISLLNTTPNLVTLEVSGCESDNDSFASETSAENEEDVVDATLLHLEQLTLTDDMQLLEHLTLPCLGQLSISLGDMEDEYMDLASLSASNEYIPAISALLSRSSCQLRTLHLEQVVFNPDLGDLLYDNPSIRSLIFVVPFWHDSINDAFESFVYAMLGETGYLDGPMLPNLESLEIRCLALEMNEFGDEDGVADGGDRGMSFINATFVNLVEERRAGITGTRLSRVCIKSKEEVSSTLSPSDVARLMTWKIKGLELELPFPLEQS